jgi:hypothetical protein
MGVGAALPAGTPPLAAFAPGTLSALPGPAANPGLTFPTISPGPNASPSPIPVSLSDASASFPLGSRSYGGQIIGLAVLAVAFTITIARLSVRKPQPQHSQDPD